MVTACYLPVVNGVTRMIDLYKKEMESGGHEVNIFTWGDSDIATDDKMVVRSPGIPIRNSGYYAGFRFTSKAQHMLADMDIVHCHHLIMSLEFANRYARSPIVFTNHTRYDFVCTKLHKASQAIAQQHNGLYMAKKC